MRKDLDTTARKKILVVEGIGVKRKRRGQRQRKSVRGNTISAQISQINLKILKYGKEKLGEDKESSPQGEDKPADEKPKDTPAEKPKADDKKETKSKSTKTKEEEKDPKKKKEEKKEEAKDKPEEKKFRGQIER
jgi:hypothetical protein